MSKRKTVIITGAAGGIGSATARKFASEGFNLVLVDYDETGLQSLVAALRRDFNGAVRPMVGDLADMDFVEGIAKQAVHDFGQIDVLVNNAAWRTIETMRTINIAVWDKTIRICLTAPAFLSKLCAAEMETMEIAGVIINISSVMSERAPGYSPAYVSAKGALESLTHELAVTYGRRGIRVVSVSPGFVDTELSNDYTSGDGGNASSSLAQDLIEATPVSRAGLSEEVASAIFWLASPAASFITGTNLLIDGGLKHNFNNYAIKKIQFPDQF